MVVGLQQYIEDRKMITEIMEYIFKTRAIYPISIVSDLIFTQMSSDYNHNIIRLCHCNSITT